MAVDVQMLDPWELMQRQAQGDRAMPNRRRSERVSYYKRPLKRVDGSPINMPGWVIFGDTQPGKQMDMMALGFRPLFQYGRLWDGDDEDGRLFKRYGCWGPILFKPGGPEEFPVEQIETFRWYDPDKIGSPAQGYEPMRWVRFPQLHAAVRDGLEIREYLCPECSAKDFLRVVFLARHLRNSHSYDRVDVLAWADSMGVDLRKEFATRAPRLIELPDEPVSLSPESEPPVVVERVSVPTLEQAKAVKPCLFCVKAKAGYCKKHVP